MKQPHQPYFLYMRMWAFMLLPLLWIIPSIVSGQHTYYRNISTKEGLSSNFVYRVHEDKKGYFWYLTDKGISRFDGVEWRDFTSDDGYDELGAFHLIETSNGTIWVVTTNFKLYCFKNQRFTKVDLKFYVSWIESVGDDVWALSRGKKIAKVDKDGRLTKLVPIGFDENTSMIYSMLSSGSNEFLISTNSGIYNVNLIEGGQPQLLLTTDPSTLIVPRMFKCKNGDILLSNNKGCYLYNKRYNKPSLFYPLKNNELISFYEDTEGYILGTFNGCLRLSVIGEKKSVTDRFLEGNIINSIFRSHSGIYYFATLNSGVHYANFKVRHTSSREGLNPEGIAFIKSTKWGKYIFTKTGLIYLLNHQNTNLKRLKLNNVGETGKIYNIISLNDSQLFIGSNRLYVLSKNQLTLLDTNQITAKYYLACYNKDVFSTASLFKTITSEDSVAKYYSLIGKFMGEHKFELKVDHTLLNTGKRLYLLIQQGLLELEYNTQGVFNYHIYEGLGFVSDVKVYGPGTVVVSTLDKGIFLISKGRVNQFSLKDGLASDYCIKSYVEGSNIWVCTNKGLCNVFLDPQNELTGVYSYSSDNCLLDDQVNDVAFDNRYVYVATDKGISYFERSYQINIKVPDVFIESIRVNNLTVTADSLNALSYDRNNISINYSSPREWGGGGLFKYVFNNGDTLYTKSTELSYGSLPPGSYWLKIWSRNSNGVWSFSPAELTFSISRPFWKTPWFILINISAAIILLLLFLWYRFDQLKKRNKMKTQLQESEIKALRLHMNPHFIFNTLNSLQKFTLERNPLEANKYISMFAKLMRWIMSYSEKHNITLEEEINFLDTYIALEQLRFDRIFSVRKEIDEQIIPNQFYIPALVVQPFVENAIKYGIAGLTNQGELSLRFEQKQDYLLVTIEDNGVGREQVKAEQLLSGKDYASTGIRYTNERLLLLLHDKLKIKNAVTITDLYDDGKPSGTKVELMIPYYYD